MIEILKIIEVYNHGSFYAMQFRVRTANGTAFLKATFKVMPIDLILTDSFRVTDESMRVNYNNPIYAKAICEYLRLQGKRISEYVQPTIQQKLT